LQEGQLEFALNEVCDRCVEPYASLELKDELSELIQSRGVRAALAKHAEKLRKQFDRWSLSAGESKAFGGLMSLSELMICLKECGILDEACTPKEVTSFFVMVNADDEIYDPLDGAAANAAGGGSAELDFDEFCEIVCRICNEKVPDRQGPFEVTLDNWLGLMFIPALKNTVRGGGEPAAARRQSQAPPRRQSTMG
jgi:hypothetical protein